MIKYSFNFELVHFFHKITPAAYFRIETSSGLVFGSETSLLPGLSVSRHNFCHNFPKRRQFYFHAPVGTIDVISWLTEDINQRSATSSLSRETAPPTIFSPTRSSELTGKFTLGLLLQMPFSVSNSFRIRFFSDSEKLHALIRNNQIQKMWIIFRNE